MQATHNIGTSDEQCPGRSGMPGATKRSDLPLARLTWSASDGFIPRPIFGLTKAPEGSEAHQGHVHGQ